MKLLPALCLLLVCGQAPAPGAPDAHEQARQLGRGLNVLGDDPIWINPAKGRFKDVHFQQIREAGFNHLRVNLAPFRQMNPTNHWTLEPRWLDTLDWVLKQAQEQRLLVILDLHEFLALGRDPAAHREPFLAFWRQAARHCRAAPETVLFEILNEPSEKLTPALWNDYLREALAVIRDSNPHRNVIIGPGEWNAINSLPSLSLPPDDPHLIVTIHYYQPFAFTHQGASWVNLTDKVGVEWTGTAEERKAIGDDFARAAAWARQHQRPLYLGEFGAYDKAPMDSRIRYLEAVARAAEAQGWSWSYWRFGRDFVVYDTRRQAWVEPILRALIPADASQSR
ncbi:MAG: glycoside hydrolase family 5 protein [Verrucomicrobia bacterium]|jgi:endoglucanase|nr:glycoside hydrolase family 5 protein [Verrucomicrobiota bacterium]